jgi:hypothetical protein
VEEEVNITGIKTGRYCPETIGNEESSYWKPRSTPDCSSQEEEKEEEIRLKLLKIESTCANNKQPDYLQLLFQQASTSPHYFF